MLVTVREIYVRDFFSQGFFLDNDYSLDYKYRLVSL